MFNELLEQLLKLEPVLKIKIVIELLINVMKEANLDQDASALFEELVYTLERLEKNG